MKYALKALEGYFLEAFAVDWPGRQFQYNERTTEEIRNELFSRIHKRTVVVTVRDQMKMRAGIRVDERRGATQVDDPETILSKEIPKDISSMSRTLNN